jgi:hypothetical protein
MRIASEGIMAGVPFVDSYRNFWAAESAEIAGLLSGLAELGSFVPGI